MIKGIIIKGVGGQYTVSTPEGNYICAARGIFRNRQVTPVIGDRVEIDSTSAFNTNERTGSLHTILPRANELRRPRIANVDCVIVVMAAAQPSFSAGMLDRYLALAEHAAVPAVICVNKCDLSPSFGEELPAVYRRAGYPVVLVSAVTGEGLVYLREAVDNKLSVLAGPSGAGKSSLLNMLRPDAARETGALSVKIKRGRHTTRHTEILPITATAFCADTPGFTSLDISFIPRSDYASLFREFMPYIGECRFSDCKHVAEAGCAVKAQLGQNIHPSRYESYLSMMGGL